MSETFKSDSEVFNNHCRRNPVLSHARQVPNPTKALSALQVDVHAPPTLSYGTHHTKAFVLVYENGLRLIAHTANIVFSDCNDKSQGIWFQDFPRKDALSPASSDMQEQLAHYVAVRTPHSVAPPPSNVYTWCAVPVVVLYATPES